MTGDDSVMINPEQQRLVLKAVIYGPRPRTTLRVWGMVMVHIQRDTGEITASCRELAEDAGTTPDDASRALNRLAVIGALLKPKPGCYAINPHVGWSGGLAERQAAAKDAPVLRPVEPAATIADETAPIPR
jgi:hypothetical protein